LIQFEVLSDVMESVDVLVHTSAQFDDLFSRAESDRSLGVTVSVTDHSDTPPPPPPQHPALLGLNKAAIRSHSMRDQTSHSREKFQVKYCNKSRRSSTKNSPSPMSSQVQSRNNSLPSDQVAITRQFLATNKKVINRGDSFKRREKLVIQSRVADNGSSDSLRTGASTKAKDTAKKEGCESRPSCAKVYTVALLGHSGVGKTSIIDQFMSSDHADVYRRETDGPRTDTDVDLREVSVDVNGQESILGFLEPAVVDYRLEELVAEHSPDCYCLVYAVDDSESLGVAKSSLAWLIRNGVIPSRPAILVANKIDLARSRCVSTQEGLDVAVQYGTKFLETSPGMGHQIDELLVGIVMQLRLRESGANRQSPTNIKQKVKGMFNKLTGKDDEKKKICRNLNI